MSKTTGTFFAALILIACAPYSHADSITDGTFNFTVTSGSPAPTGSFVWDNTTSKWNSFTVNWDGAVFNFTSLFSDPAPLATSGGWCAAATGNTTSSCAEPGVFSLDDRKSGPLTFTDTSLWGGAGFDAGANGTYTITETPVSTTPEPGSLVLMLFGVAALGFFAMRRRATCGGR